MKGLFDKLEHGLRAAFQLASGTTPTREPIEIRRAILHEIAGQVQPKGGGVYFFPFRTISVEILARDDAERELLEASFDAQELAGEVHSQIADRGCEADKPAVLVTVVKEEPGDPPPTCSYRIRYERQGSNVQRAIPRPAARLLVLQGNADARELTIDRDSIYIGRLKDVMFQSGGLERRNDLAFDATETTVSRRHALVKYDATEGKFRAFNDPTSSLGTRVLRGGKRPLVCDSTRGVQLRCGDELILGDVRVRFEITSESA